MKGDRASKGLSWDFLRQVKVRFGASKHVVCMIVVQMHLLITEKHDFDH